MSALGSEGLGGLRAGLYSAPWGGSSHSPGGVSGPTLSDPFPGRLPRKAECLPHAGKVRREAPSTCSHGQIPRKDCSQPGRSPHPQAALSTKVGWACLGVSPVGRGELVEVGKVEVVCRGTCSST